jgi:hypothetical protein
VARSATGAETQIFFFDPSGKRVGGALYTNPVAQTVQIVPQPDGFAGPGWSVQSGTATVYSRHFSRLGGTDRVSSIWMGPLPILFAGDLRGGLVLAGRLDQGLGKSQMCRVVTQNADMSPRWDSTCTAGGAAIFALGMDVNGNVLVVTDGSPHFGAGVISAEWFSASGMRLNGEFALLRDFQPGPSTWFDLWPLVGGGLAVRRVDGLRDSTGRIYVKTQWLATATPIVFGQSATPRADPAPDWLTSRPDTRLYLARGGKAYALVPEGAPAVDCGQSVEIVTADGGSCGSRQFRVAQGQCRTLGMTVGLEGTLIQQTPQGMDGAGVCSWHYFPGALR